MSLDLPIRVYVADAHGIARHGAVKCLEDGGFDVVGEAGTGGVALAEVPRLAPDVLVVAEELESPSVLDLLEAGPLSDDVQTVVVCTIPEPQRITAGLAAGATGYVTAAEGCERLHEAVAAVARGETSLSPAVQQALVGTIRDAATGSLPVLSRREREVLTMAADNLRAPEIALRLSIGASTVSKHQQNAYEKLGVRTGTGAVAAALRLGIID
jgi:DNA-binding NarL/FixJ family response regulator